MKLLIATNNDKKVREFHRILEPCGVECVSLKEAGICQEIEETGATFEENSRIKAQTICDLTGLPAVADDSGLAVDCLDGAPGVYSARYAGENATDDENVDKLLAALKDVPDEGRTARFVSVITIVFPDGRSFHTRGECAGQIAHQRIGYNGFGYDPIFQVGEGRSFASIPPEEKDAMSHRGKALRLFAEELKKYL
ncbi:XTP/dITP diphosphatase [Bittarella massiliensis (ex Durand et al. 2017)]|uniref:XTP/dITP diphosphatase n=1 Tax=Bittarella massiliensis (ex Durand et al. 2017) TaxID=1720313 RepID=UPI001AA1860A|nr:XTP/dITP diphosphatase [Bittarella massiliensis (ex Durand et al. 2017)]